MGFNLGAFAGGLAQSGMKTYSDLDEMERRKAADAREAERLGFERQRAAEAERQVGLVKGAEEQMRYSALPTSGGVPLEDVVNAANPTVSNAERAGGAGAAQTDIPMSGEARQALQTRIAGMSPQEQAKVIQGYGSVTMPNAPNAERAGGAAAAIPLANAVTYKDQNGKTFVSQPVTDEATIVANMKQRAYESGNPVAIKQANDMEAQVLQKTQVRQAIQLGSKQLLSADRIERDAQKVEDFNNWHSGIVQTAQKDPMEAAKAMVVEYNTGAQHQDGRTAKIVTGPDAAPLMVFVDDKTGKQVGNGMPITPETVQQGIQQMAFQKWQTLPGNFAKGVELKNKEKELVNQGITAEAAATNAQVNKDTLKLAQDKFAKMGDLELKKLQSEINAHNADANWRNAAAKEMGNKPKNWEVLGVDTDGTPISHNKNDNTFARSDGAPIKDVEFFKKITGEKIAKPAMSNADISNFVRDHGELDSNIRNPKEKDRFFKVRELPLDQQRAQAEQFYFGKSAGGLPDVDTKKMEKPGGTVDSAIPVKKGPSVQDQIIAARKPIGPNGPQAMAIQSENTQMELQRDRVIATDKIVTQARQQIKEETGRGGSAGLAKAKQIQQELDAYINRKYPASSFQAMPYAQ